MASALDVGYLSAHLGVPEETLGTVATTPTADLVRAVLDAVATKAREYEELYASKLNVEIELEGVARSSESRCQTYKTTADTALKDVEDARRQLQEEGTYILLWLFFYSRERLPISRHESLTLASRASAPGSGKRAADSQIFEYNITVRD